MNAQKDVEEVKERRKLTEEESILLHRGVRPEWMEYEEFKILRKLSQNQLNRYLKGRLVREPDKSSVKEELAKDLSKE